MHQYTAKKFDLPAISGLSEKQITIHLGLYEGYVKHINVLREQIADLTSLDKEKYAYAIMEVRRRLGFEFNGMRMHEYYFSQFEGGPQEIDQSSALVARVAEKYGSWDGFISHLSGVAMGRGIGWSVLYYDPVGNTPHVAWVSDHELGQLGGLPIIYAIDMWEHAFMVDYLPTEKKQYVETVLKNTNWEVVDTRYTVGL
jgi:superoxide dismutase, Fe-Mn family